MDLFSLTFWGEKGRNSWVLDRDRGTGQEKRQRFNTEITEVGAQRARRRRGSSGERSFQTGASGKIRHGCKQVQLQVGDEIGCGGDWCDGSI